MAGKIPAHFINDLIGRTDIVDVIGRRVPLIRKGREFAACCPFHNEKTPSFTVSPGKQFYHCFGCGASGTAIGFMMAYDNLSFVEAVEELAALAGLSVPREESGRAASARPKAAGPPGAGREALHKIMTQAQSWFQQQLKTHPEGQRAVAYLKGRGLDGRMAADFGLGYAPAAWDALTQALGQTGLAAEELHQVGLVSRSEGRDEQPGRYYDRFRGRIMFPIVDRFGKVAGFGGRILQHGEPKYLNSPDTPLFSKKSELYGMHRARRAIGIENRSFVVEGYMDVIQLAQCGIDNVVATMGTATTRAHLQWLFRSAPEIVFCFDGDRAGRDAAWKALQVVLPEMNDDRQVSFLFLADGEDPDTTVRNEGAAGFRARADKAVPLPEFLFDTLTAQVDMTREDGKVRLVNLAMPLLHQLPVGGMLKEKMLATLTTTSGLPVTHFATAPAAPSQPAARRGAAVAEGQPSPLAFAVSLLLQYPGLGQQVENPETVASMTLPGAAVLYRLITLAREGEAVTTARLLEAFRHSAEHGYLQTLAGRENYVDDTNCEAVFADTMRKLHQENDQNRRRELVEKARTSNLGEAEKQELQARLQARANT